MVNFNYDGVTKYPKLDYSDIVTTDVEKLATAYNTLKTAGAINPSMNDEQYFRTILGLPEKTDEEKEEDLASTEEDIVDADLNIASFKDAVKKSIQCQRRK